MKQSLTSDVVSVAVMYFAADGRFVRSEIMPQVMPHEFMPLVRNIAGDANMDAVVLPSHGYPPQLIRTSTPLQLELDLWNLT